MEYYINQYGKTNTDVIYNNIDTYKDLIDVNIGFLENKIDDILYHGGPVDDETKPLLDKLIMINKNGFMSVEGQPGIILYDKFINSTWKYRGDICGSWYVSKKQKSYISGFMEYKYINKFIDFIKQNNNYGCYIISNKKSMCKKRLLYSSINRPHVITVEKKNYEIHDLIISDWHDSGVCWYNYDEIELFDKYPNIINILQQTCYLTIFAYKYGNEYSVEDLLLDFYKNF
jgi:hypothetical protein